MDVQRKTLDTIDTVDRLLDNYGFGGFSPKARSLHLTNVAKPTLSPSMTTSSTQTEVCAVAQKASQTVFASRSVGTETCTTVLRSISTQTERDNELSDAMTAVHAEVAKTGERLEESMSLCTERVNSLEDRLTATSSRLLRCSQAVVHHANDLCAAQRSELVLREATARQQTEMDELSSRHYFTEQLCRLLLSARSAVVNSPGAPSQPVGLSSSQSPYCSLGPEIRQSHDNAVALLLEECVRVLEDDF